MKDFKQVIEALECLKEDSMTIKRVKEKADQIILLLQQASETNLDKALRELEDLDSPEIPSYDRTQLWDIISMLEGITSSTKP